MKKGNTWPMARARWVINEYVTNAANCPVWCWFQYIGLVYIDYILDIPVPITLVREDFSLGQWSYRPTDGAIVWHGTWRWPGNNGDWWFEQRQQGSEYVYRCLTVQATVNDITGRIVLSNRGDTNHGSWSRHFGELVQVTYLEHWDPPWFPSGAALLEPQTYAEIRATGVNPDDLAPVTWNFVGP